MLRMGGGGGSWPGVKSFVISRTMKQADHADVTIAGDADALVRDPPGVSMPRSPRSTKIVWM
jgi:hypothetical protein